MAHKSKRIRLFLIPLFLLLFIVFEILFEKFNIQYKQYTVQNQNIPSNFDDFKIIQLSDIHYKADSDDEGLEKMVEKINAENPDIIVLTGDYIDYGTDYIKSCTNLLSKLKAKYGVYAVMGNHEGREYHDLFVDEFTEIGINVIEEAYTRISIDDQSIYLCGISDFYSGDPDIDQAISGAKKEDYVILLSHNPNLVKSIDSRHVDLMFSGHNHGGQITLFGLYIPYLPDGGDDKSLATGKVQVDDTTIIVSNGIGTTLVNFRFFARPQVVITTLQAE